MGCSYDCKSFKHIFGVKFFSCTHINQKYFSLIVYDWVLRLNISINNIIDVQVFYGKENTTEIIPGYRLI